MMRSLTGHRFTKGFSLLEMAIVLAIVGALIGGLLPMISGQMETQHIRGTRKQLDEAKEALIGFVMANGRLPCPASSTSNGQESFCTNTTPAACGTEVVSPIPSHGRCKYPFNGYLPGATLGMTPISSQGYILDGWNNPVRYAVTTVTSTPNIFTFTAPGAIQAAVQASGSFANLKPDLTVCASSPNPLSPSQAMAGSPWCGSAISLTTTAPAVIYSTGTNGNFGNGSADELANASPYANPTGSPNSYEDKVFVSHDQTPAYDDLVVWISPNSLINRLVAVGKLP